MIWSIKVNKIEFEDLTKEEKSEKDIYALTNSFILGALDVGTISGYSKGDIIKAFLLGAESICDLALEIGIFTKTEIDELKQFAVKTSKENIKMAKKSGDLDLMKDIIREAKGNFD